MPMTRRFRRRGLRASLSRPTLPVDAVLDEDLWLILEELNLLAPLDGGELTCARTGVPLTRENVGGIIITPDGPRVIADLASGPAPGAE